jgi:hypothetical protein
VHGGMMELAFLASNDADHYLPELRGKGKNERVIGTTCK